MSYESEIIYRDFWDVPRIFIVWHGGQQYLFDCSFNESVDDYEEVYRVYALPYLPESELNGSWKGLSHQSTKYLGDVPIMGIKFDSSKRKWIDTGIIDELWDNIRE